MLQSEILDPIFIAIRDANIIPAGRLFFADDNPSESRVTITKAVIYHEPTTSRITTLGGPGVLRRRERGGIVRILVLTPLNPGASTAGVILAEQIQSLFEGNPCDAPLHYDNVTVRSTGRDGTAAWVTSVVITYRLDVVK